MEDSIFKNLAHGADGYFIMLNGQEIDTGYKPDVVLRNGGDEYIIIESETGTNRKAFLGNMMKAAKYLSGTRSGIAVLVIKEHSNTTVEQIYRHLIPYFKWIMPLTNITAVYLINAEHYCVDAVPLKLLAPEFLSCARVISREQV